MKDGEGKQLYNHLGVLSYINGDKYNGQWKENLKNGKGIS